MHAVASKTTTLSPTPVSPTQTSHSSHVAHEPKHHHIWLVTGPAGCGKSTIAKHLAKSLDLPYIEGDEHHPTSNIHKMANNIPLTDADRWDWLTALREESLKEIESGYNGVVLTCSALKRKYRDVIRVAPYYDHNLLVHFIYLDAPEETIRERVRARQNHYMPSSMVQSQFNILERPGPSEVDVITVDSTMALEEVKAEALSEVLHVMENDD